MASPVSIHEIPATSHNTQAQKRNSPGRPPEQATLGAEVPQFLPCVPTSSSACSCLATWLPLSTVPESTQIREKNPDPRFQPSCLDKDLEAITLVNTCFQGGSQIRER